MTQETLTAPYTRPYSRFTVMLVLLAVFGILLLWMLSTPGGVLGKADAVGYAVCHRIVERSFIMDGRPLPLCARCTGIYMGAMTALGVFLASGRARAGRIVNWRVGAILALFVVVLGIDGVNSYLNLFPGYDGPYAPRNWLRLTTGVFCGFTLMTLIFPIFNQSLWADGGAPMPPLRNLKELGGLCLLGVLVIAITLTERPAFLLILGLVSAAGVVTVLTLCMAVLFVTLTGRFQAGRQPQAVRLPLIAGLGLAMLLIGVMDFARLQLTGTWEGFIF